MKKCSNTMMTRNNTVGLGLGLVGRGDLGAPSRNHPPIMGQDAEGKGGGRAPQPLRLGSMNVRGCSSEEEKREEIGRMFLERELDVLALSEVKIKGTGDRDFGSVAGRVSGVRGGRAREGVAILLSPRLQRCVVEWKELNSRLMWVKLKLAGEIWCVVSAYGPGSEKVEEERLRFWTDVDECLRDLGPGVNVLLMGDFNARVGEEVVDGVVGRYGVPGRNESGESLIELCVERELTIANTCFRKKNIHKYTWQRQDHGRVVAKALMDYVVISKGKIGRLLDVRVMRGAGNGLSDHFLVEGEMKLARRWGKAKQGGGERKVLKARELEKAEKVAEFQEMVNKEWRDVRTQEVGDVEEEWSKFKKSVVKCAEKVCGMRKVGGGVRKGSEWWCEEVKVAVEEKKRAHGVWLQKKSEVSYERYKECKRRAMRAVRFAKARADERWGRKLTEDVQGNKRMFWKEVKKTRKGPSRKEERVKAADGRLLVEQEEVGRRWGEYFEGLLNVEEEGEPEIRAVGGGGGVNVLGSSNEAVITFEEVQEAVKETRKGKAPGLDGCAAECLKSGGVSVMEWLVRLFNVCFLMGVVPSDWVSACIVPLYKGKGDKHECSNYRGISLLSVVGKVYGKILIKRIRAGTEEVICDVQGGFRRGMGCVDQVFAVRQICEKYMAKGKDVFWAFMDLEKAYDRVDRTGMWDILKVYGVGGRLLEGVKSFYENSRACVRVGNSTSEWFTVKVGLRQGCAMSPWLFNIYMDGVVREVNASVLGRGLGLVSEEGEEWCVNQLLFADDTALVADTEEKLARLVREFARVCGRRKLKVNVGKSKVMKCTREARGRLVVRMNGEELEEVESFKYLGSTVAADGGVGTEVRVRVKEAGKVLGGLNRLFECKALGMGVKKMLYEGIVVPTALYGAETWNMGVADKKRLNVMEMRCLRSMCGVTRMDRVRNEEVRRRTGVVRDLAGRAEQCVLRWFGHVERMEEGRLVKRIVRSSGKGGNLRGRPRKGWMDSVKEAVKVRGGTLEQSRVTVRERSEWRAFVAA